MDHFHKGLNRKRSRVLTVQCFNSLMQAEMARMNEGHVSDVTVYSANFLTRFRFIILLLRKKPHFMQYSLCPLSGSKSHNLSERDKALFSSPRAQKDIEKQCSNKVLHMYSSGASNSHFNLFQKSIRKRKTLESEGFHNHPALSLENCCQKTGKQ